MSDKKVEVQQFVKDVDTAIATILDNAITLAIGEGISVCHVYDGLSNVLAQRLGQLEMFHIESDLQCKDPDAKITKEMLSASLVSVQINALASLQAGMETVLTSRGHFSIKQLKKEINEGAPIPPKTGDEDSGSGRTFH
jgi:hypothetical protein